MIAALALALAWICVSPAKAGDSVQTPAAGMAHALALDREPDKVRLRLPPSSREEPSDRILVPGPWRLVGTVGGVRTWEARLPVRPRTLFFNHAPDDMALFQRSNKGARWHMVAFRHGITAAARADSWEFTSDALHVRREAALGPPAPGEYAMRYTRAVERERSLNRVWFEGSDADFAMRSLQVDDTTRHGLFLPAPASASVDLTVPAGAVLDMEPMLLPPEAADVVHHSDGATVRVEVVAGDRTTTLLEMRPPEGRTKPVRIDLSKWSGQQVTLRIVTDPGPTNWLDYVFIADPVVYVPQAHPPRVWLVFIDTLRRDHLSLYGYKRQTTPNIDAFAESAAVFDHARAVAPWTLPSTRNMMTGAAPEAWGRVPTLADRFGKAGWATTFVVGNIYLSSNFDMSGGWGEHRCVNWPRASVEVDRALDYLDRHPDRPAFVALQFMDMHLPYTEPLSWRHKFAGDSPPALGDDFFLRSTVKRVQSRLGKAGKQYIRDRYDNNLAYIDHELARVFSRVQPHDTLVLLADHGEEFWDHGGFEHGHTLYDELLQVPLVVRADGVQPGRYSQPVSLGDVAPTLAKRVGLSTDGMTGWPLQDLTNGDRSRAFVARPLAFGRLLYGDRAWGVLADGHKYITQGGVEQLFDLANDPHEKHDLWKGSGGDAEPWREWMQKALHRTVELGFRMKPTRPVRGRDLTVDLTVPGGVKAAWPANDPTKQSAVVVRVEGEHVIATWQAGHRGVAEVFVVPERPAEEVVGGLSMATGRGANRRTARPSADPEERPKPGGGGTLAWLAARRQRVELSYVVEPIPSAQDDEVGGFDSEVSGELKALGYVEDDDSDGTNATSRANEPPAPKGTLPAKGAGG